MLDQVLLELALLFALCVAVAVTFHRLRLPPIVGFLVAGVLVGPNALELVPQEHLVRELAEVGIVVLLFAVGLEVPLQRLRQLRRTILVAGGVQIVATIAATALVGLALGIDWPVAVFLGCLMSLSSTAASTKMLVDHGEVGAPHGRVVLGIAIAQDLAVVPMILLVPLLGTATGDAGGSALAAAIHFGLLCGIVVVARLLVRPLTNLVSRTRSRELFVLFLVTWCLGLSAITAHCGMSLALGAFLAGILLADSDHHGQAVAEMEPFRDAFASLFFVSIGMLFDWRIVAAQPGVVTAIVLAVVVGKGALIVAVAWLLGQPYWVRIRAALTLAQVGEFSFVLVQLGRQAEVMPASTEGLFVVAAVVSIAATPLLYAFGQRLAARVRARSGTSSLAGDAGELVDHAIVVGFGPTGQAVAAGLRAVSIPFVAIDMNLATVRAEKERGVPIVYGDASRLAVLRSLGVERASLVMLAVNDLAATRRIVQLVTLHAPQAHVLVRAAYHRDVDALTRAGAHEVVPQELEASVEIMVRALRHFVVADDEVGRQVQSLRTRMGSDGRTAELPTRKASDIAEFLPGLGFAVFKVDAGAPVVGKALAEFSMRQRSGCTVVALRRGGTSTMTITPETVLEPGDTVVVIGPELRLSDAAAMFAQPAGKAVPDDVPG